MNICYCYPNCDKMAEIQFCSLKGTPPKCESINVHATAPCTIDLNGLAKPQPLCVSAALPAFKHPLPPLLCDAQ